MNRQEMREKLQKKLTDRRFEHFVRGRSMYQAVWLWYMV